VGGFSILNQFFYEVILNKRIEERVGANDGPRATESNEEECRMSQVKNRKLYQRHFPKSVEGKAILGIHFVEIADKKVWVLHVTDSIRKEAYAIAKCDLFTGSSRSLFVTLPGFLGHVELCQLLRDKGIRGKYLYWLEKYEEGNGNPGGGLDAI